MDPALKEYLDKLHQDAKANSAHVLKQLQTQSSQIEDLLRWKPDLEARFAKLETTVVTLQAAAPSATNGAALHNALPLLLQTRGPPPGPDGHGVADLTGGARPRPPCRRRHSRSQVRFRFRLFLPLQPRFPHQCSPR